MANHAWHQLIFGSVIVKHWYWPQFSATPTKEVRIRLDECSVGSEEARGPTRECLWPSLTCLRYLHCFVELFSLQSPRRNRSFAAFCPDVPTEV